MRPKDDDGKYCPVCGRRGCSLDPVLRRDHDRLYAMKPPKKRRKKMPQLTNRVAPPAAAAPVLVEPTAEELRARLRVLVNNLALIEEHVGAAVTEALHNDAILDELDARGIDEALDPKGLARRVEAFIERQLDLHRAEKRRCQVCPVTLWFIRTKAGKLLPLCHDGTPHWANCRAADQFRRKG